VDEEHTLSLMVDIDHKGEEEKIKLNFFTNKNTLIILVKIFIIYNYYLLMLEEIVFVVF
jgi:hypothetical protein